MPEAAPERSDESPVTRLLRDASFGNREAFDRLLPLVYAELRILAQSQLRRERDGHTLNATALVHEAYVRLVGQERVEWAGRAHFYGVAAQAMRRVLINYAEGRRAQKRGGGAVHVPLDEATPVLSSDEAGDLVDLDEALTRLEAFNERGARVVEYRFFGGLTHEEIADVLGVSTITVRRAWTVAKSWLRRELGDERAGRTTRLLGARG